MRTAAFLLALCLAAPAWADSDPVIAQRGGFTLTASAVRDILKTLDPEQRQRVQSDPQALAGLVRDRLLQGAVLDEAHAKQWDQRPEVIARATQAHDAAIADSYIASITQPEAGFPSEQDVQNAYDQNKAKLITPRQYHVAQIFAAVPFGATRAVDDDAKARIADLRAQALKPKADFAAIARKSSEDKKTAPAGGDIGWVREDQMLPAIRGIVAGMTEGGTSDPVRLGDGWHLVRLIGTRPAAPATLPEVHDGLVRALRQAKQQQNARTYVDGLLARDPIQLNEIELGNLVSK